MTLVQTRIDRPYAFLTLQAPPVNVIDTAMIHELDSILESMEKESDIRYLVVESALPGKFSAGVSVPEHHPEQAPEMIRHFHRFIERWLNSEIYTVAKVDGFAYGGAAEWLLVFDRVFVTPESRLGFPEVKLAFFPPVAMAILPDLVGYHRACEIILSGKTPEASMWKNMGWDLELVDQPDLDETVKNWLEKLDQLSHPVVKLIRRSMRKIHASRWIENLRELENIFINELLSLEDPLEGVLSFMEKRQPVWKHR